MYTIQICPLSESLSSSQPHPFEDFAMAKKRRTLRGARKEYWKWVNHQFGMPYLFRIVNKHGEPVQ